MRRAQALLSPSSCAACCAVALCCSTCSVGELDIVGKACPCPTGYACNDNTRRCERLAPSDAQDAAPLDPLDAPDAAPPDATDACTANLRDDPLHCGRCGHSCLGGTCSDGKCQPVELAAHLVTPNYLALDARSIYCAVGDADGGTILRLDKSLPGSGAVTELAATYQPWDIAVDDTHVYWTTQYDARLMRIGKDGGTPSVWSSSAGGFVLEVVLDNEYAYYTDFALHLVRAVSKTDAGEAIELAPDAGVLFPEGLAVDEGNVYFTEQRSAGRVFAVNKQNRSVTALASDLPGPRRIEVDDEYVYWVNYQGRSVMRASKTAPGEPVEILRDRSIGEGGIAVDSTYIYATVQLANTVIRVPKGGGLAEDIASGQGGPVGIAVDSEAVYWTGWERGTIVRVAK